MLDTVTHPIHFQQLLLILDLQRKLRANGIDQTTGVLDARKRVQHLIGHFLGKLDVLLELIEQYAYQCLLLTLGQGFAIAQDGIHHAVALVSVMHFTHISTRDTFNQYLDGTVRQLKQLHDLGHGADGEKVIGTRIVLPRFTLRHQ